MTSESEEGNPNFQYAFGSGSLKLFPSSQLPTPPTAVLRGQLPRSTNGDYRISSHW